MRLWLDDLRPAPRGWEWATTALEAIDFLRSGRVKEISLDHDLGPEEAGSGYDVASEIERLAWEGSIPRLRWSIHSMNPVGVSRMKQALESADRFWSASENLDSI